MSVSPLPLVSVIIPCYNRGQTILTTLQSVFDQVYENVEVIIVDDGSTDETPDVIKKITQLHPNIHFYQREGSGKGGNACRNQGLAKSCGEYILFLDSDDLLRPFCISERIKMFTKTDTLDFIVFPGATFANDINADIYYWNIPSGKSDLERFLRFDGPWQTSGALWNRESLIGAQLEWDQSLHIWQDIDFHVQALLKGLQYDIYWTMEPDYLVRSGSIDSISRTNYNTPEKIISRQYFWKKYTDSLTESKEFSGEWLQQIFLIVLKAAVIGRKFNLAQNVLETAAKLHVISAKQHSSLKKNMVLSWITFNKMAFPSAAIIASFGNYKPSVQRVPISNATKKLKNN